MVNTSVLVLTGCFVLALLSCVCFVAAFWDVRVLLLRLGVMCSAYMRSSL